MRPLSLLPRSILALLLGAAALAAQSSGRLIGLSFDKTSTAPGEIHAQDILQNCPPATSLCKGILKHPGSSIVPAGGSAWDTRNGLLWVTDGATMEAYQLKGCSRQCSVQVVTMDPNAVASGLAISESQKLLWMLETRQGYVGLRPWLLDGCTAVPTRGGCTFVPPSNFAVAGGLALDEARQLLYFTVSEPGLIAWIHTLYVAKAQSGAACQPLCKIQLRECSLVQGPITGLAHDPWTRQLFATDGQNTRILSIGDPANCAFKDLGCCKKGINLHDWVGLAWQPAFASTVFGKGCSAKPCAPCPSPLHGLGAGSPSIGNPDFTLTLRQGPTGSFGVLLFGGGRCTKGVGVPFLCTAIYPALQPPPLVFGIGPLLGMGACDGTLDLKLPIPADAGLCGATLCTQWLMVCSGPGFALSNALEWEVTGG